MPAFLRTYGVFQLQDRQEIRYHIETLSSLPVEFIAVFFGKSWSIRLSLFICSKRILANPAVTFYPFCTLPAKLPETCSCIKTGHFTIGVFRGRMVVVLHNYHPAKGLAPSGLPECSALRFSHSKGKRHERQIKQSQAKSRRPNLIPPYYRGTTCFSKASRGYRSVHFWVHPPENFWRASSCCTNWCCDDSGVAPYWRSAQA